MKFIVVTYFRGLSVFWINVANEQVADECSSSFILNLFVIKIVKIIRLPFPIKCASHISRRTGLVF